MSCRPAASSIFRRCGHDEGVSQEPDSNEKSRTAGRENAQVFTECNMYVLKQSRDVPLHIALDDLNVMK